MSDKCEWKDGVHEYCTTMGRARSRIEHPIRYDGSFYYITVNGVVLIVFEFCPFCGADIRKPDTEKFLIVKDGKTYAAYSNSINYLCIKPNHYMPSIVLDNNDTIPNFDDRVIWKPFSEIESLTDEIALLRPLVIITTDNRNIPVKLYGITELFAIVATKCSADARKAFVRLATPPELQEIEK